MLGMEKRNTLISYLLFQDKGLNLSARPWMGPYFDSWMI
jgi:hypothetical protein